MKYQVKCMHTDEILFEGFSRFECGEWMDYEELGMGDAWIDQVIPCRGCDKEGEEREDWYGISTGYWCDGCYESNSYPYKRKRYATEEHDGHGERLSEDY